MPTLYKSTDPSAPVITGQVGALTTALLAILVNGYGSKAAAGWTNPFNGTNQSDFLQGGSGIKKYFQFDDNGPGLGGAKEARMWGFETMSAYNTGTQQFPTSASNPAIRKSATADATARDWLALADAKTCHMWILTGDTAASYMSFSFGDYYSFAPGDEWKGYVCGRTAENSTGGLDVLTQYRSNNLDAGNASGMSGQRSYTGFGPPVNLWPAGGSGALTASVGVCPNRGSVVFPNAADGKLLTTPMRISQGVTLLRGRFRGIYCGAHPTTSFNDQDIFSGVDIYSGKTFLIIKSAIIIGGQVGYWIAETSAWDEST